MFYNVIVITVCDPDMKPLLLIERGERAINDGSPSESLKIPRRSRQKAAISEGKLNTTTSSQRGRRREPRLLEKKEKKQRKRERKWENRRGSRGMVVFGKNNLPAGNRRPVIGRVKSREPVP
jgi:hypothetical protein